MTNRTASQPRSVPTSPPDFLGSTGTLPPSLPACLRLSIMRSPLGDPDSFNGFPNGEPHRGRGRGGVHRSIVSLYSVTCFGRKHAVQ